MLQSLRFYQFEILYLYFKCLQPQNPKTPKPHSIYKVKFKIKFQTHKIVIDWNCYATSFLFRDKISSLSQSLPWSSELFISNQSSFHGIRTRALDQRLLLINPFKFCWMSIVTLKDKYPLESVQWLLLAVSNVTTLIWRQHALLVLMRWGLLL